MRVDHHFLPMMLSAQVVIDDLRRYQNPDKAQTLQRFFKTGPGQYGAGDRFWGITVPVQRRLVKEFRILPLHQVSVMLAHPVHEVRLTGLLIAVTQYLRGSAADQQEIYEWYVAHRERVNNWDLVDLSAPTIVGDYLFPRHKTALVEWAASPELWTRRIAMVSTLTFIRRGELTPTLRLAEQLLTDPHDLMHKATGWMLREVGKKDEATLRRFLDKFAPRLPRTALRYAIERLAPATKHYYLTLPRYVG